MICPFCRNDYTKVVDSRTSDEGATIRRRRECETCQRRFSTYERFELPPVMLQKKNGTTEAFMRDKLLRGLQKACVKRSISTEKLYSIIDDIELSLSNSTKQPITTTMVGELALQKLKEIDEVAYVRFASVYREFSDVKAFFEEMEMIYSDAKAKASDNEKRTC